VRFALFYAASLLPEPHVKLHANAALWWGSDRRSWL